MDLPVTDNERFLTPKEIMAYISRPSQCDLIEELVENADNYSPTVARLMKAGLLKSRRICRNCNREMRLRKKEKCYIWVCRKQERKKRVDCSSVAVKSDSWFQGTKLSFETLLPFLIMHSKNCSTIHMLKYLNTSLNSIDEARRKAYQLTDSIVAHYPKLSGTVYTENIVLTDKRGNQHQVFAGQHVGSRRCFAVVCSSQSDMRQVEDSKMEIRRLCIHVNTVSNKITEPRFFDEVKHYKDERLRFFTNLRSDAEKLVFTDAVCLQNWLNDQVVRRTEGVEMLDRCLQEMVALVK